MNISLVNKQHADTDPEMGGMMEGRAAGPPAQSATPAAPRTPAPSAARWRSSSASSSRCTCAEPSGARGGRPSRGARRDPGGQEKKSRHHITLLAWSLWDRPDCCTQDAIEIIHCCFSYIGAHGCERLPMAGNHLLCEKSRRVKIVGSNPKASSRFGWGKWPLPLSKAPEVVTSRWE